MNSSTVGGNCFVRYVRPTSNEEFVFSTFAERPRLEAFGEAEGS